MKRRLIVWLLVLSFVWLVIVHFAELSKLAETLSHGVWGWAAAAAGLQLVFYIAYATLYRVVFSAVHVHIRLRDLLPMVFGAVFVNIAVPSGGTSGIALFIDGAVRHGQSAARTAAGVLLVLTVDFASFTVLLGLGLAYLSVCRCLHTYEIVAAAALLGIILSMCFALTLGLWKSWLLLHLLRWVQLAANWVMALLRRPNILADDWAAIHAMDFAAASLAIAEHPLRLTRAFFVALTAQIINLAGLYTLFLAFYHPIGIGMVLAGYAIGNLFWIVSITPQGVGVVEGIMALIYTSLGVPVAKAAVIVLAYRGLALWLPLLIGFFMLRHLKTFKRPGQMPSGDQNVNGAVFSD